MTSQPYCEHPECHASRTSGYSLGASTRGMGDPSGLVAVYFGGEHGERLCRIHALQRYKVAFGS